MLGRGFFWRFLPIFGKNRSKKTALTLKNVGTRIFFSIFGENREKKAALTLKNVGTRIFFSIFRDFLRKSVKNREKKTALTLKNVGTRIFFSFYSRPRLKTKQKSASPQIVKVIQKLRKIYISHPWTAARDQRSNFRLCAPPQRRFVRRSPARSLLKPCFVVCSNLNSRSLSRARPTCTTGAVARGRVETPDAARLPE